MKEYILFSIFLCIVSNGMNTLRNRKRKNIEIKINKLSEEIKTLKK